MTHTCSAEVDGQERKKKEFLNPLFYCLRFFVVPWSIRGNVCVNLYVVAESIVQQFFFLNNTFVSFM